MNDDQDDRYDWIPLKEYAGDLGVSPRTVTRWIHLKRITARRNGPMAHSPWVVRVFRSEPARTA